MSAEPDPLGVTISAREIYDQIVGLRDDVRSLTQSGEHVTGTLEDHEERLRTVERWKYSVPAGVLTAMAAAVVSLVNSL